MFCPANFVPIIVQIIAIGEHMRRLSKRPASELVIECELGALISSEAIYGDGRPFNKAVSPPPLVL